MSIKSTGTGKGSGTGKGAGVGAVIGTDAHKVPAVEIQGVQVPSRRPDEVQEVLTDRRVKSPKNGVKMDEVPAGAGGKVVSINQRRGKGTSGGTGTGEGAEVVPAGAGASIGRPKGAGDKVPRKRRTDSNQLGAAAEDRVRILKHTLEVSQLGRVQDRNDPEEVRDHVIRYLELCVKNEVLPTVAGLAQALGIDRRTLWTWMDNRTGLIKSPEVMDTLKGVYTQINSQYESLLTTGKIIPVAGFFLLQNNYGYQNQQTHVIAAEAPADPDTNELATRAGLLTDGDPVADP